MNDYNILYVDTYRLYVLNIESIHVSKLLNIFHYISLHYIYLEDYVIIYFPRKHICTMFNDKQS